MDMILAILRHTPSWVWVLLAALVTLGLAQLRSRRVTRARIVALPLALLAFGVWNLAPTFAAQPLAALAWAAALLAAGFAAARLPRPAGARWLAAEQRLELPGSWLPLALIVAIFALRYGATVALVLHPGWRAGAALPLALLYGAISGLLAGRALGLLRLAQPQQTATTMPRHGSVGVL